jgi:hypothetical protein
MPMVFTQNWLSNLLLPLVSLTLILLSASAVSRRGWFPVRPVLSTYIWMVAITSFLGPILYFLQIPQTLSYVACRVYFVIYDATVIAMCFFSVAVLYEFLFRMAGTDKVIRRTAVAGFVIAMCGSIAAAYGLMRLSASPGHALEYGTRLLNGTTALALMASGLFIFVIMKRRSLLLETRFSLVLAAFALYNFISLLSSFILRRTEQMRLVVADIIWIAFAGLLYWALKNGPAISATANSND